MGPCVVWQMHVNFKPNAANHPQVNTIFRDSNHAQVGWLFMATRVYHISPKDVASFALVATLTFALSTLQSKIG